MADLIEYAQLSNRVYSRTRPNRTPVPSGWNELQYTGNQSLSGFSAGVYQKGTEIVIAYTGTNEQLAVDFALANFPAGLGFPSAQVTEAMILYLDVRSQYPNADISFTGHSLGGGLASLMSVFFDKPATVFDAAPFEITARNEPVLAFYWAEIARRGYSDPAFRAYTLNVDGTLFYQREAKVIGYSLEGEILAGLRANWPTIVGGVPTVVPVGMQTYLDGIPLADPKRADVHSMTLLAAALTSTPFANMIKNTPNALQLFFDRDLYYRDPQFSTKPNFLDKLYIGHVGDVANGIAPLPVLDLFARDIEKLGGNNGVAQTNSTLRVALTTTAMEYYYFLQAGNTNEFFHDVTGGIKFDLTEIGADTDRKGQNKLTSAIRESIDPEGYIKLQRPTTWYLQAGDTPLIATSTDTHNTAMIGGTGDDTLESGAGNDYLNGGGGVDTLRGGAGLDVLVGGGGDDNLYGGDGKDLYIVNGNDHIFDSDGSGVIKDKNGQVISGFFIQTSGNQYVWAGDTAVTATKGASFTISLKDGSIIELHDFQSGQFGLTLSNTPLTQPGIRQVLGDIVPEDQSAAAGDQLQRDANGSWIGHAGAWADVQLEGNNGADHISAGALSDWARGMGGDDRIEMGTGDDVAAGMDGNDVIEGNAGHDILSGGAGDDLLYADINVDVITAITAGNIGNGSNTKGGWLTGGDGNDVLVGNSDNELMFGSAGSDLIIAGQGDDMILGDSDYNATIWYEGVDYGYRDNQNAPIYFSAIESRTFDWSYTDSQSERVFDVYSGTKDPIGSAGDVVFAGTGDDWIRAGRGDDVVYGEDGNDNIAGEQDNDSLFGGAGNDRIVGDASYLSGDAHGDDYISGGDGNDTLAGEGGSDNIYGDAGDDTITGDNDVSVLAEIYHGDDTIDGGAGNDTIDGGGGNDTIFGGDGNDFAAGGRGNDFVSGDLGNDQLMGGDGDDTLVGGQGIDTLQGQAGKDTLDGGDGDDVIDGGDGNDELIGGMGNDQIQAGDGDDIVNGGDGDDAILGESGNDRLDGGAGNDSMVGNDGDDSLLGGSGDDTLWGDAGNDYLDGGTGSNILEGGEGDDTLVASGAIDVLRGGAGNDTYNVGSGSVLIDDTTAGNRVLLIGSGSGISLIISSATDSTDGSTSMLVNRGTQGQIVIRNGFLGKGVGNYLLSDGTSLSHAELMQSAPALNITGSAQADTIFGSGVADTMGGGAGNDNLAGQAGDDTLSGGIGNDTLSGGLGNDTLIGGAGSDVYTFARGDGADVIEESDPTLLDLDVLSFAADILPTDIIVTRDVNDLLLTINGTTDSVRMQNYFLQDTNNYRVEEVRFADSTVWDAAILKSKASSATALDDTLFGGAANDTIDGLSGNDTISGLAGVDRLYGSAGNDLLIGGAGDDILRGGNDNDTVRGEADNDSLYGDSGNDLLDGGDGFDGMLGGVGDDTLVGGAGNDTLYGEDGNDFLDGGTGDEYLFGGLGSDTYIYRRGDGVDHIYEYQSDPDAQNLDVVQFSADLLPGDIDVILSNTTRADLELRVRGTSDVLFVDGYFSNNSPDYKIEQFRFADATIWTQAYFADLIAGKATEANDTLSGMAWNDVIDAKGGDDVVRGYEGDDTLSGALGVDRLYGEDGNDSLNGGAGDDLLDGGIGNDLLVGGANQDTLYGDDGNDVLDGGSGDDTLYGDLTTSSVSGDDTLNGGAGNDVLHGKLGNDTYLFARGEGADLIYEGGGTDRLVLGAGIAPTDVTLYREADDLIVVLDASANQIRVSNYFLTSADYKIESIQFADNTMWDGTAIQSRLIQGNANTLTGTAGNDTFVVDHTADVINEAAGAGTDLVQASVSYTLSANVENLTLTGALNASATGNSLSNVLIGNSNNNTLDGKGGADTLQGGAGDDTYVIDASDTVIEVNGGGTDTVVASALTPYTLPDYVENLRFGGSGGFTGTWTGNALDNVIDGGVYGLSLTIDGGAGADTMIGVSSSSNTYYVDNVGDIVWERFALAEGAFDTIISSVSYSLPTQIETLVLRANIALTGAGNDSANTLDSFDANNSYGTHTLIGLGGDDTYIVGQGDSVVEQVGGGTDFIKSYAASIALSANVENLWLMNGGIGIGNALDNVISNKSTFDNAVLDGGAGNDTLVRRSGTTTGEVYVFDRGYGNDVAPNAQGTVRFGANTRPIDIVLSLQGSDLVISYPDTADTLRLQTYGVTQFEFADGTRWSQGVVNARLVSNNANSLSINNDVYAGSTSADMIDAQAGNDTVSGGDGDDTILGGEGDDIVFGNAGHDVLDGGSGYSELYGGTGNDTLIGSGLLVGGSGSDSYRFGLGINATITESGVRGELDRVIVNSGIAPSSMTVTQDFADLVLSIAGTGETLRVQGFFNEPNPDADTLPQRVNNDLVMSVAGYAQTLTLSDYYLSWGGSTQVTYNRNNDDLIVGIVGRPETLRVTDYYYGKAQIEQVVFADGTIWDTATLIAKASVITGTEAADTLSGTDGDNRIDALGGNDTIDSYGGNDRIDGGAGNDIMRGGAGDDTYIVDSTSDSITELAGQGTDSVVSSATFTLSANVENLTLTGTANINATGNTLNNTLTGNGANNTLSGGTGTDSMTGGTGNDTYVVDNVGDTVVEALNEGTDLVQSSVTYTLAANVENLTLTGTTLINATGNGLDNVLIGNTANNTLTGGAGNDTLNGGTGTDTMVGGIGDDIYVVDVAADVVTEALNEGTDTVQSAATYTVGANVENLTLTGTAVINGTGNALNNTLTGNTANNILDGGAGDDTLDGGAGTDTLKGGLGNDTFIVDSTTDTITENLNEGTDTVRSSVTYTLGTNVDNLVLTGTAAINATGNTLNNTLTGNSANNTLSGGTGNDTTQGAAGNDTYVVDSTLDTVVENLNEGVDLVQSSVTYGLSNNVENITLTGTTAINATGNTLNNVLTGNTGVNVLTGGTGDDTYVVGTGDSTAENLNEGTDTVQSTITWTLGTNIENLTLTGTAVVNGTGNVLNNVLVGNTANNILDGGAGDDTLNGGTGTDTMKGGLGNDTFVVDVTTDVVTENLNEGVDIIQTSVSLTTLAANVEGLVLTGTGLLTGVDNALNNMLTGNTVANTLTSGTGNDILQGGDGNDTLKDTVGGNNLFNGGTGVDAITGIAGNELFIGGTGNDTITTGTGADVIVFNRGDGQDLVNASTGADNAISIGGGIKYSDMLFRKNANDLILDVGATEQITLKDWYAATTNKSVVTLQMIEEAAADFNAAGSDPLRNKKIENFDFAGLVTAFDQARTATPTLTSWALTNALTTYHLGGSDTAALGGDLAYQYGKNGNLSNVSFTPAQTILGNAQFGSVAQTLQPLTGLQDSSARLS